MGQDKNSRTKIRYAIHRTANRMASVRWEITNPFQLFLSGLLSGSLFFCIFNRDAVDVDMFGSCGEMDQHDNGDQT